MVSKTLVKLIDEAIIPAVFLVAAKVLGTILAAVYFDLSWEMTKAGIVFSDPQEYLKANSYSSLLMFTMIILGLAWVIVRGHVFHNTHIKPSLTAQLASVRLLPLVQNTMTIYSSAIVWLSYAWLVTAVVSLQAFYGLSYPWVAVLAFIVTINATWLLVVDVEREIFRSSRGKTEESVTVKEKVLKIHDLEDIVS